MSETEQATTKEQQRALRAALERHVEYVVHVYNVQKAAGASEMRDFVRGASDPLARVRAIAVAARISAEELQAIAQMSDDDLAQMMRLVRDLTDVTSGA